MSTYWICRGDVRGDCEIKHRSYEAALRHCEEDDRQVKAGHGPRSYSDRRPVEVPRRDGPGRPEIGEMVHVRLPEDLIADIDGIADDWGETRSATIRRLLADGVQERTV